MNKLLGFHAISILLGLFKIRLTSQSETLDISGVIPLYDLCPYTNYCTRNATKRLDEDNKTPCCDFCSCTDDCWERGNCCLDKHNIVSRQPLTSCMDITGRKMFHGTPRSLPQYYVIQRCPTLNDTLTEKCNGNHKSSLNDFMWVTDVHTNKIYNNKYCAACHGVVNFTQWHVATDCLVSMDGQTSLINALDYVINTCTLFNVPLNNGEEQINRCFVPDFSFCNETGKWQINDPALESACRSFEQLYHHEENSFNYFFRNVYCFLCNSEPHDHEFNGICDAKISSFPKTLGFTAILHYTAVEKAIETRADGAPVCPSDEIGDPFQAVCLKLTCPMLHVPVYEKCEKLISSTSFLGISVNLKLYPERGGTLLASETSELHVEQFAETFLQKLQRKLGVVKGKCKVQEEALCGTFEGNSVPETFAVNIKYTTTELCQEDFIIDRVEWFLSDIGETQFDQIFFSFTVDAFSPIEYYNYCKSSRDQYHSGTMSGLEYFDFQRFIGCPSVSLNASHYVNLMKKASKASQRKQVNYLFNLTTQGSNVAPENATFTSQVCFESYSSVLRVANDGVLYDCEKVMFLLMAALSCLVCTVAV